MPTVNKWLLTRASQDTDSEGEVKFQIDNIEQGSSKCDSQTLASNQHDLNGILNKGDNKRASPLSSNIHDDDDIRINGLRNEDSKEVNGDSQQDVQEAIDTSGCWSIGAFSQDVDEPTLIPRNFREPALFSQIANSRDEIDDNSSYSSILGDLSPSLSEDDLDNNDQDVNSRNGVGRSKGHNQQLKYLDDVEWANSDFDDDLIPKQQIASALPIATPSNLAHKAPVFISSKSPAFSILNSNSNVKPESSKRKHNQISNDHNTKIQLVEGGLAMKAKTVLDADHQAHVQWDTDVRGYMAQLGSVAFLGPIYPNTQLFRIANILDDKGLVYAECVPITEPPEEVVWNHVSAAENQSQYDDQTAWSPTECDDCDTSPLQIVYFSFVNSSLSQAMRARFNQSHLVRIWPPWHEYLLDMDDGSVATIKLVTQFITDAIY